LLAKRVSPAAPFLKSARGQSHSKTQNPSGERSFKQQLFTCCKQQAAS